MEQMLKTAPEAITRHVSEANQDNAQEIVRVARVLVPAGKTARAKAAIKAIPQGDGQLIDFGPLSKILEGGTEERQHKDGHRTGKGPKIPFVSPAMKATYKKRRARTRKAIRDAVKEAQGNG